MEVHLEVLVEEPSMEAALREILPKIANGATFEIYPFQSKQDLLEKLPARFRGYARWIPPNYRIVVLVDRDGDKCKDLKAKIDQAAEKAKLTTRSKQGIHGQVISRLVIEELESWFFGDWQAVRSAFPKLSSSIASREGFRDPDAIAGGTWEALEKLLQRQGYYRSGLRKIEVAREVAKRMDPQRNRSKSFQVFRDAILDAVSKSSV